MEYPTIGVRPDVLDRAQVQLAFVRAMLGDVGKPQHICAISCELPLHSIVVDRRAGLASQPLLLRERGEDPLPVAQPPDPVLTGLVSLLVKCIGDQTRPESGVGVMDVHSRVDQCGIIPVPLRDRIFAPR